MLTTLLQFMTFQSDTSMSKCCPTHPSERVDAVQSSKQKLNKRDLEGRFKSSTMKVSKPKRDQWSLRSIVKHDSSINHTNNF